MTQQAEVLVEYEEINDNELVSVIPTQVKMIHFIQTQSPLTVCKAIESLYQSGENCEMMLAIYTDIFLKGLEMASKSKIVKDSFESAFAKETSKAKSVIKYGYEISQSSTTKYTFDGCNDPLLAQIEFQRENLKQLDKEWKDKEDKRKTMLKNIDGQDSHLDEESGELTIIYPAAKTVSLNVPTIKRKHE